MISGNHIGCLASKLCKLDTFGGRESGGGGLDSPPTCRLRNLSGMHRGSMHVTGASSQLVCRLSKGAARQEGGLRTDHRRGGRRLKSLEFIQRGDRGVAGRHFAVSLSVSNPKRKKKRKKKPEKAGRTDCVPGGLLSLAPWLLVDFRPESVSVKG